jgi:zinc transport system substrate-binding protein
LFSFLSSGCHQGALKERAPTRKTIATSDSILSGISESLLPAEHFEVTAILPPGQCPGHYDMKLSNIAKVKQADLIVSFLGMLFMERTEVGAGSRLLIDAKNGNWMAPNSYIIGLKLLADKFSERFPIYKRQIEAQRDRAVADVVDKDINLRERMRRAGISQKAVIASSMLREPLQWIGFQIAGEYGRPESISAKDMAALIRIGKERKAVMVVDNLQSGPDAGKEIAEALGSPHVILSNFPSLSDRSGGVVEFIDRWRIADLCFAHSSWSDGSAVDRCWMSDADPAFLSLRCWKELLQRGFSLSWTLPRK